MDLKDRVLAWIDEGLDVETIRLNLQATGMTLFHANMLIGEVCAKFDITLPEITHQ